MTRKSESAESFVSCSHSRCVSVSSLSSSSVVRPMMPFIGVRISWLMFARNSLLVRFDSSACSRACSSSRDCVCSWATVSRPKRIAATMRSRSRSAVRAVSET